ncbi:aryl-sulfate sulfotransferase [Virgibacillus kekensis]|uniref:Aryl-sulfate sulfotransferase n=1 Tax=Virgibacillus kekensis TaxID=202261 RepID=A0ABV9DHX1_9BACI
MNKKTGIPILAAVIVAAGAYFIFTYTNEDFTPQEALVDQAEKSVSAKEVDYKYPPTPVVDTLMKKQKKVEQQILKESEGSTFSDPYINLDPYNRSPLSALIVFETEEEAEVTFTVKSKNGDADITKTIHNLKTQHQLPVLGLYPNFENTVVIEARTESGKTMKNTVTIKTSELPEYIPEINIKTLKKDLVEMPENGLTFAVPSTKYPYGFDLNGDIRWYSSEYNSHVFKQLENGNFIFLGKDSNRGKTYNRLFEINLMGKIYNAFKISAEPAHSEAKGMEKTLIHHDISELPSGNLVLTVHDDDGEYLEDTMIVIDRQTGDILKEFDLKNLFPKDVYENFENDGEENATDWFHQNSVVYDESDTSLIISGRNQDAVMKIDYETGDVIWTLAHPEGWSDAYEKYLIKGQGEDFKYPGGQHDPTILPDFDNNPDTIDLLIYDNNVVVTRGDEELSEQFSAATHYRINEETLEAEVIWTYGKERGPEYFTNIIGSAKYMQESGNILVDFGWVDEGKRSHIVEVTEDEEPKVVFEAVATDFPKGAWVYRSQRYSLYPDTWERRYWISNEE